jgi:hypothetical protein
MNDETNGAKRSRASFTKTDRKVTIAAVAVATIAVVAAGTWYVLSSSPARMAGAEMEKAERKVLYWTDPMVPGFKSDKPGKSPFMDMQLVPIYQDDTAENVVSVRPEIAQSLGVRTHTVGRDGQTRRVATSGYVFRDAHGYAVLVDLMARDAGMLRVGSRAEVRVVEAPGQLLSGVVEAIETDMDIGARTVKARIRLNTVNTALRPNLYAEVTILSAATNKQALLIPREALIRTGTRNAVVLALGEGRFQPVEVTPGAESDDWIEIVHGIKQGDVVVTSGQFLIDSEASVRASFGRMEQTPPAASPAEPKH